LLIVLVFMACISYHGFAAQSTDIFRRTLTTQEC
jgi:hypothetical protein